MFRKTSRQPLTAMHKKEPNKAQMMQNLNMQFYPSIIMNCPVQLCRFVYTHKKTMIVDGVRLNVTSLH